MRGKLTVQVIGALTVRRGDAVLGGADVGSRKARLLLARLAVERGHWISTDRITEAVWPDCPERRPNQNVAILVSRLRGLFGPGLVEGGRAIYRLGGQVAVDLDDAAALVSTAERAEEPGATLLTARLALELLEQADDVLGGEPDANWAEPARRRRTMLVRRARLAAANTALQVGDLSAARDVAERAVADDALDEPACRILMVVHVVSGEPARALIAYERLRGALADELGAYPATATRDLHVDILRGRPLVDAPRSVGHQLDPAADILGRLDAHHLGVIRSEMRENQ